MIVLLTLTDAEHSLDLTNGSFFKFGVEVGVEESIVNTPCG
jgi:hypothetical protein